MTPTGYPAILLLDGRLAVVVGAGTGIERKVRTLLDAGARVRVVDAEAAPALEKLAVHERVEVVARAYRAGDLDGAAVAVAATDDPATKRAVFDEATGRGIPVNAVDDPANSTFTAPAIVRRGDLVIAITTGGASPALAVRIRERLEAEFGEEYGSLLTLLARLRTEVELASTAPERAAGWYRVVDSDVPDLVRAGKMEEAYERAVELLKER